MTERRSTARKHMARALWYAERDVIELRTEPVFPHTSDQARVKTDFTGISRGTERLVLAGAVPQSEWEGMRAPLQSGEFPFPVKYGYCATGVVESGPNELIRRRVFCLHPHQDIFNAPLAMLVPIPDPVPSRRAVLAANMETALNAHWDAGTGPGDRIAVVGAGIVGLMVAAIAARLPGADVTVFDIDGARESDVRALGAAFSNEAPDGLEADVVFHTSASTGGLDVAISLAGMEGRVVEVSWYGDRPVTVSLGGSFHRKRLSLVSTQVGQVASTRRARWNYRRRVEKALALLDDPVFDRFVAEQIAFEEAPRLLPEILKRSSGLAPVICY